MIMRRLTLLAVVAYARPAASFEPDTTGALTVCVLEARDLLMLDPLEDAHYKTHTYDDPKPVLHVGTHMCSLATRHSQHPFWKQCCYFGHQPADAMVRVKILDKDAVVDDLCGVTAIKASAAGVHWLPLKRLGSDAGEVKVNIAFEADTRVARGSLRQLHVRAGTSIDPLPLQPAFNPEIYEYHLSVDEEVETVAVEPLASEICPKAGKCSTPDVQVRAGQLDEPTPMDFITLSLGRNTLHVVVAPRTKHARTYVLHVHRAALNDASLLKLFVDGVHFVEPFEPDRLEYSAMVEYDIPEVRVHAMTRSEFATINGQQLGSKEASELWKLHVGANVLMLRVVAEDGESQRQYMVTLQREGIGDALVEAVEISPVGARRASTLVQASHLRLSDSMRFEAHVAGEVDAITVSPRFTADDASSMRVNARTATTAARQHWPLQPGRNMIQLLVWREGKESDKQLYTLLVTRDAAFSEDAPTYVSIATSTENREGSGAGAVLATLAVLGVLAAVAYACIVHNTRVRLFMVDKLLPREGGGSLRSSLWQLAPFTKLDDDDDDHPPPSYPRSPRNAGADPWGASDDVDLDARAIERGRPTRGDGELEMGVHVSARGRDDKERGAVSSSQPVGQLLASEAGPSAPVDFSKGGTAPSATTVGDVPNPFLPPSVPHAPTTGPAGAAAVWQEGSVADSSLNLPPQGAKTDPSLPARAHAATHVAANPYSDHTHTTTVNDTGPTAASSEAAGLAIAGVRSDNPLQRLPASSPQAPQGSHASQGSAPVSAPPYGDLYM